MSEPSKLPVAESPAAVPPHALVAEAFAQAAETMAFVTTLPLPEPGDVPPDALRVSIRFGGPVAGTIELAASEAFGAMLAANLLGPDSDEAPVPDAAVDALRELANVTCGVLLPKLSRRGLTGRFEMGVPSVRPLSDPAEWSALAADAEVMDADGFKVAVRVEGTI